MISDFDDGCERLGDNLIVIDKPSPVWLSPGGQKEILRQGIKKCLCQEVAFPEVMPSGRSWPKISIVTVTRNQAAYLEETICSVLGQNYPNLQYIVIDGASDDDTPAILERYRAHLDYFVSEPDNGQADALNKGFARADGEVLAWLNSDDRYLPDTLFRVAMAFDVNDTEMIVGGCALVRDREDRVRKVHHCNFPVLTPVSLPEERLLDLDNCWLKGDFFYQPEVFWSRELWQRCGGRVDPDLYYSMDYELWVRMARAGARICHIPEILTLFREHREQKTAGEELPYIAELRELNQNLRAGTR
jgi:glycosyltransferase involved in cell wall biosynthesis